MASYFSMISHSLGKSNGKLSIVLDDTVDGAAPAIRAGKRLSGVIELELEKEVAGEELTITLKGKEKSIRKKGPVDVARDHEFYTFTLPVRDMKGTKLKPGKTCYPFSMDVPSSLPSSVVHRIGLGDVGFNIQYKLCASLGLTNKTMAIAIAAEKLENNTTPYIMHPTAQTISGVNGSKLGSITYAATVEDTNIQKGDDLVVNISCRNDSTCSIQRVEVKVVELLNWGSKEGYNKSRVNKETLVSKIGVKLPGLQQENDSNTKLVDATYRTVEAQNAMDAALRDDLVSGHNTIKLECPLRSRDSYTGTLVDIRHYLKIKFVTNGYGSGSQPSIKVPLNVGLPEDIPSRIPAAAPEMSTPLDADQNDDDLPVASLVPMPSSAFSPPSYDQRERELEPVPRRKSWFQRSALVQAAANETGQVELDMGNLVPMLPPSPSFE